MDKTISDRKHLVSAKVDKLRAAVKGTRHEASDRCLLLLMFHHGLRVSEACRLLLSQADIESRILHIKRLKDGLSMTHPLQDEKLRVIKAWLADHARMKPDTGAFFISEWRSPLSRKTTWLTIRNYGRRARLPVEAHPHMLRHACGYKLANDGHDTRALQHYLGHKNIQHTVRYTEMAPDRFKNFWRD